MCTTMPDIRACIDPILGAPYEEYRCWNLARYLMQTGLGLDIVAEPLRAAEQLSEIWFEGDPRDPLSLVQPWDLFVMVRHGDITEHVGVVVDAQALVHTRLRTGVVVEPLQRWRPKLLQLARLRMFQGVL
jgi:hypothetical protein